MRELSEQIKRTVEKSAEWIGAIDAGTFEKKSSAKWSKKEVLGHLVDSAQNNLQRLIRVQHESIPKIIYDQDEWMRLSAYQSYDRGQLLQLWVLLNHHYCHVLRIINPENLDRQCDTGKQGKDLHTLKFLAEDYLSHMLHHLSQIREE